MEVAVSSSLGGERTWQMKVGFVLVGWLEGEREGERASSVTVQTDESMGDNTGHNQ